LSLDARCAIDRTCGILSDNASGSFDKEFLMASLSSDAWHIHTYTAAGEAGRDDHTANATAMHCKIIRRQLLQMHS
jgi:hypothetical protein